MRSAKERTHDKKRRREQTSIRKTEESRARRLANKAKRTEIISINSHAKIKIIDQETYVDGVKVEIVNNRIVPVESSLEPEVVIAADEGEVNVMVEAEKGKAIDAQVEKERLGVFNPFKWKKK